ncbi:MAG: SDR family NAD(P)-dependent oxidoreductase [Bacteroidales bacterium]|jgi:NADP-dependent 3-hydroxy acid dehydrogenase YdfG|nr:SDR family NAD(P)-dependent oxidoreductase [Bacteroidales bacterium]
MSKIVCVTGATSGIGRATAEIFAANGYNLIITGRRKELLEQLGEELVNKYKIDLIALNFDVRNNEAVNKAFDSLPEGWRNIDILVNNAGLAVGLGPIQEGVIDDWERMIDTNVKGLLYVSRKVLPWLVERKKGHVFNIASIAGKETYLNGNVYCATKSAVDSLSKAMRMDMVPYGIKVTNVAPGAVETEFSIVRFKGDQQRADNVYKGYEPLTGQDIANTIYYVATLPDHVCINDLLITPKAQASASIFHKE